MNEVLLDHSELLYLLETLGASGIVGIPADELFPGSPTARATARQEGEERLLKRHLLILRHNGPVVIDTTLATLVTVITQPDIAILAIRHAPPLGPQLFLLSFAGQYVVEHTLPADGQHLLTLRGGRTSLVPRLMEILPLPATRDYAYAQMMDQAALFDMKRLAEHGETERARSMLLVSGFTADESSDLLTAIAHPRLNGTVALLHCSGKAILDARNIAIVAGEQSAWLMEQRTPGEPVLDVRTTDVADTQLTIIRHLQALAPSAV